ncbi:MAG: AAA domain-containing protein [Erysipelotrichaceae bacterium]|nr:AAA domain-containing protein [Erysipelotrichaceae bacterium]
MIDPTKEMIVLKGKIKTYSVKSCIYNQTTKKWDVTFINGKTFSYAYNNVEKLYPGKQIDLSEYNLQDSKGKPLFEVKTVYVFKGSRTYYHVIYRNGYSMGYSNDEIRLVRSVFQSKKSKDIWEYFKQISEISNLLDDSDELILKKQFEKIGFISENNALSPYLNSKNPIKNVSQIPIFPFGCNTSQYKAVEHAIYNQLSVIQGPPGTGKTQTILNIIANLLVAGKNIQIVSNNNSAIENVQDKLASPKYGLDFIVAKLGKVDNKKEFIENQIIEYPDFSDWEYKGNIHELISEIHSLSQKLKVVYADEEAIAKLTAEKSGILVEKFHFDLYVKESGAELLPIRFKKNVSSSDIMHLWQILLDKSEKGQALALWEKIILFFKFGLRYKRIYDQDFADIIHSLQAMFYDNRIKEIDKEVIKLKSDVESKKINTDDLTSKSMEYLKHVLAKRYSQRNSRRVITEEDFWKNPQDVLEEYPVTLSTTFASKSSLGSRLNTVQYDYLIMDEASQVDIATGVLALSSSFNAVIVGDTKQLPNVITEDDRNRAEDIFKQYDIPEGYKFTKSFLQSILDIVPDVPMTLLREHYRCHPKIINFCNQKFYSGELLVMTHDKGEDDVIKAITTVAGNHERDRFNQRQIDIIKQEILSELDYDLSEVGIISPYRNQVNAIRQEIPNVDVNTVHKFQGREKDTIIISTVDDEKNDFSDNPYLINVAVSRAKKHLYIVASGNNTGDGNINDLISYIRYNNCEVIESKVYSIFDYLFSNYSYARMKYLKEKKRISEYDSENLMFALLSEIIEESKRNDIGVVCHLPLNLILRDYDRLTDEEKRYATNPLTHLDFAIYSKISKKILAAIEVDGYTYHKKGTKQSNRDLLKNSIFEKYDIPLLRFSTTGSGEKERLNKLLVGIS